MTIQYDGSRYKGWQKQNIKGMDVSTIQGKIEKVLSKMTGEEIYVPDLVASFQNAVVDVLVSRAITAAKEYGYKKLAIAGGVASNSALRAAMKEACDKNGITFYHPSPIFCTDNAAMIGVAAYYEYIKGNRSGWDLNAVPNLKLGER